jgi:hypothetical protein
MWNYLSRAGLQIFLGLVVITVLVAVAWLAVEAPHLPPAQLVPGPPAVAPVWIQHLHHAHLRP